MSTSSTSVDMLDFVTRNAQGEIDPVASKAALMAHVRTYLAIQSQVNAAVAQATTDFFKKQVPGMQLPAPTLRQLITATVCKNQLLGEDTDYQSSQILELIGEGVSQYLAANMAEIAEDGVTITKPGLFYSARGRDGGLGLLKDRVPPKPKKVKRDKTAPTALSAESR